MPVAKLVDFLDRNHVRYVTIRHSPAYTAQEVAARAHVPGKELAKTVMIEADGRTIMAVLPASHRVDLGALARVAGAREAHLAAEDDFRRLFPECEPGAMPPFGNLWDVPVFVARELEEHEEIAFSAGTHSQLVRLRYEDFRRLVEPEVADFALKD